MRTHSESAIYIVNAISPRPSNDCPKFCMDGLSPIPRPTYFKRPIVPFSWPPYNRSSLGLPSPYKQNMSGAKIEPKNKFKSAEVAEDVRSDVCAEGEVGKNVKQKHYVPGSVIIVRSLEFGH